MEIKWDFDDGNSQNFENYSILDIDSADTTHSYTESGVYNVVLKAEEMTRNQEDTASVNVMILAPGINVIPVITEPEQGIGHGHVVDFNANQSYVADCDYDDSSYDFQVCDLYCDYIHAPGTQTITGNYDLIMNWTFPRDPEVETATYMYISSDMPMFSFTEESLAVT